MVSRLMKEQTRERTGSVPTPEQARINSGTNHDAVLPPARDPRLHRRPHMRRACDAQSVLYRLQIVDSSHAKAPLRSCLILRPEIPHRPVEEDVSGCFRLSRSPHTQSLRGIPPITAVDMDAGGWISTFYNLVHLHLETLDSKDYQPSLALFHGLSPTLRSLRLTCTPPDVLDLICSFPLLEDLAVISPSQGGDVWSIPPTSPKLTGSLDLRSFTEIRPTARGLLNLPHGLHFSKITVGCFTEDVESTMGLVSRCSDTLESLSISYYTPCALPSASTSGQYLTTIRARHV